MHTGPDPQPATEGWTCAFYARGDDPAADWDSIKMLRHLWQAARLAVKVLPK